ncbi:MAG: hypothetical protein LV468_01295 [Candidatus Nitrosotenuis sp.]|nr:hypothetical protein [Candidatus Nitrosotenuis sp.]
MNCLPVLALVLGTVSFVTSMYQPAYAQVIQINGTQPCFFNYTAGPEMLQNCDFQGDYVSFALLGWEWITGGNFSLVLVSVIILGTYLKYHKAVYPILIGVMFLPIAAFVFPDVFLSWGILMAFTAVGILVWYAFIKQTKEY